MRYTVSQLSKQGTKKVVLTVDADRFEEKVDKKGEFTLHTSGKIVFYRDDEQAFWSNSEKVVASVAINECYVIEEALEI